MMQTDLQPEEGVDPRKYEVGAVLRVVGYADENPHRWRLGSLVTVEPVGSKEGGIVCRTESGDVDILWPEEVEVVPDRQGPPVF